MGKEILDDNYFEPNDNFKDDIDIMDRWAGMFAEGTFVGLFAMVVGLLADLTGINGTRDDGLIHQKVLVFLLFVVLNKDFLNGQSLVTLLFNWLIVIVATIFPKRRFGDFIAGTKLVRVKEEKIAKKYFSEMVKYRWGFKFWFSLVVAGFYSWVMVGGGFYFLKNVFR